ncbi:MAG: hypothetical protein WCI03_15245, partial [bacterium]
WDQSVFQAQMAAAGALEWPIRFPVPMCTTVAAAAVQVTLLPVLAEWVEEGLGTPTSSAARRRKATSIPGEGAAALETIPRLPAPADPAL